MAVAACAACSRRTRRTVAVVFGACPAGAYHLNVGRLVLTHFCGAGNQPRMRVTNVEEGGKRIAFEMYDITNLADADAYHSTRVDVVFLSETRVDLGYRGVRAGKETTQVFQLSRRNASRSNGFSK